MTFTNIGNEEDEYFSVGLSEDLVSALSRFSEFVVLPRQARSTFESESAGCQEVRDTLGAHYVLDGTVRRSEQTLRITAKLLDTSDCTQLWSESFDRSLTADNVFAVQDEITSRVLSRIGSYRSRLLSGRKLKELQDHRTDSLEAYGCVLLSEYYWETYSEDVHKRSQDCLERAVEIDPNYSTAQTQLGLMYIDAHKYRYGHVPPDALELALVHIQKAIELNPRSQEGYYALAVHNSVR